MYYVHNVLLCTLHIMSVYIMYVALLRLRIRFEANA